VKDLEEEVRILRSYVKTLAKGEELHKEVRYYNARDYGTRGLGYFPNPIKETPRSKELYGCFINKVGSYCQHCKVTGHHTRECPTPTRPLPTLPNNFKYMYNDNHFLLMKKTMAKLRSSSSMPNQKSSHLAAYGFRKLLSLTSRGPN
jgi:hypothetical protein